MTLEIIATREAPEAIGPYSQAVVASGFVFTCGQIPLDPATGAMVGGTFSAQATRVIDNLRAVLDAAGCTFDDVVKTTVFLTDLGNYTEFNRLYAEAMGAHRPARSVVQVAALPKAAPIEVEMVACRRG